jgi:protein-tyrosine phosphatase
MSQPSSSEPAALDVLVVCTANQCRSPMAEALLRHHLRVLDVPAVVRSAGRLPGGQPAAPRAIEELARRGLDLRGHTSTQLDVAAIRRADLVLALARENARDVLALEPDVRSRLFTVKDLVRRGEALAPATASLRSWLMTLSAGRSPDALLGWSRDDDVPDPMGGRSRAFGRCAAELDDLTARAATLLAAHRT